MSRLIISTVLLFTVMLSQGFAKVAGSMMAGSTTLSNGLTMYFRLYVPRSYTPEKKYPLVVTLHGVGEKGSDDSIQVDHEQITRPWMMDSVQKNYASFNAPIPARSCGPAMRETAVREYPTAAW